MVSNLAKAATMTGLLTFTPIVPLLSGTASEAQAHTYVGADVTIGTPVAVLGFSYGNPFVYGHVHHGPVYCEAGPLYYYPRYHVYAHYYPRHHYYSYGRPRYYYRPHVLHHHRHAGHPGFFRSGHGHRRHGHDHAGHGHARVRGHRIRSHHR